MVMNLWAVSGTSADYVLFPHLLDSKSDYERSGEQDSDPDVERAAVREGAAADAFVATGMPMAESPFVTFELPTSAHTSDVPTAVPTSVEAKHVNADEEKWQRRMEKRVCAKDELRASKLHQDAWAVPGDLTDLPEGLEVQSDYLDHARRPREPNPYDRMLSKRQWEEQMATWKMDLRMRTVVLVKLSGEYGQARQVRGAPAPPTPDPYEKNEEANHPKRRKTGEDSNTEQHQKRWEQKMEVREAELIALTRA